MKKTTTEMRKHACYLTRLAYLIEETEESLNFYRNDGEAPTEESYNYYEYLGTLELIEKLKKMGETK